MEATTVSSGSVLRERSETYERIPLQVFIPISTFEWLGDQYAHLLRRTARAGRATIIRAILRAFKDAGVEFPGCGNEADIYERVRAMIRPTSEVHS